MGKVHVGDVPLQAQVHSTKTCFLAGLAVSVTLVPAANDFAQCLPQLIPFGTLMTVPLPVLLKVSVNCCVASTARSLVTL